MGSADSSALPPCNASRTTGIKICGITRVQDAQAVAASGAELMGLNFASISARKVEPEQAATLIHAAQAVSTGANLRFVGLFVNADAADVVATLDQVPLDYLQFHGDEDAAFCEQFGRPYIKAIPMRTEAETLRLVGSHPNAVGWLIDSAVQGQFGGTGHTFDWRAWPSLGKRGSRGVRRGRVANEQGAWMLAGGLTANNVGAAIAQCQPDWVDVSTGVEGASKREKSAAQIAAFVAAVVAADAEHEQTEREVRQ